MVEFVMEERWENKSGPPTWQIIIALIIMGSTGSYLLSYKDPSDPTASILRQKAQAIATEHPDRLTTFFPEFGFSEELYQKVKQAVGIANYHGSSRIATCTTEVVYNDPDHNNTVFYSASHCVDDSFVNKMTFYRPEIDKTPIDYEIDKILRDPDGVDRAAIFTHRSGKSSMQKLGTLETVDYAPFNKVEPILGISFPRSMVIEEKAVTLAEYLQPQVDGEPPRYHTSDKLDLGLIDVYGTRTDHGSSGGIGVDNHGVGKLLIVAHPGDTRLRQLDKPSFAYAVKTKANWALQKLGLKK